MNYNTREKPRNLPGIWNRQHSHSVLHYITQNTKCYISKDSTPGETLEPHRNGRKLIPLWTQRITLTWAPKYAKEESEKSSRCAMDREPAEKRRNT